jgi:hypothetical protein
MMLNVQEAFAMLLEGPEGVAGIEGLRLGIGTEQLTSLE